MHHLYSSIASMQCISYNVPLLKIAAIDVQRGILLHA